MLEIRDNRLYNSFYGTYPCVVHAQGDQESILLDTLSGMVSGGCDVDDLEIITYNNGSSYSANKKLGMAEASLDKLGVKYTVLGAGIQNWQNVMKLSLAYNFLRKSDREYVLSLDSSDVVVMGLSGLVEYFSGLGCGMLFNAEACPFDRMGAGSREWREHEESLWSGPFRYLNAGVWIGRRDYALRFLDRCMRVNIGYLVKKGILADYALSSEQVRVKYVFMESPEVRLDYECRVFQTILDMKLS